MSHFYGWLQGGRGDASRTGTRASGIDARVQNRTAQLVAKMWHEDGRGGGRFILRASSLNYGSSSAFYSPEMDVDALLTALSDGDVAVTGAWDAAMESLREASALAHNRQRGTIDAR